MATARRTDELLATIAEAGATAPSLRDFRERALAALQGAVRFDAALFHAFSPRVPLETAAFVGLDPARIAATVPSWDRLAVDLEPLRELANRQEGVASDTEAFAKGTRARARFEKFASGVGVRSIAMVHLVVRGSVRSAIALFHTRSRAAFSTEDLRLLRRLAPALALADVAQASLDDVPRPAVPVRMQCVDQRLTARQREIVELVARGHTNIAVAEALGLSPNTLRNHLAEVFRRLGASNRADVVRLAVLSPSR